MRGELQQKDCETNKAHISKHGQGWRKKTSSRSGFLLEGDVPDIKADLGPVLDGDAVSAEELELLDLPISRIHLPTVHITRVKY